MIGQIIFGILVGVSLKVLYDIDFYQHVAHVGTFHDCKYLELDMPGPEDFQFYKNNIILIGSGNFGDLFYKEITQLEVNGVFAIIDSHLDNFTVKRLNIIGFPQNVSLHIHGIDIVVKPDGDGDKLYVVNHAFKYGGERIEVFEILPNLDLKYTHSIIVDQKYNGGLNDLVVMSPTRFLVTQYQPETNSHEGRAKDTLFTKLSIVFSYLFKIKRTFLLDCQYQLGDNPIVIPQCKIVPTSWTVVANGMTWDGKDRFWVADSLLQEVLEFRLVNNEIVHHKNLKIGFGLDNVVYHKENDSLYLGMITRLYEFFDLERFNQNNYLRRDTNIDYWSTLGIYDLQRDRLRVVAQSNEFSKGTSTWLENGNNAFIGSWGDISVQVCKKN